MCIHVHIGGLFVALNTIDSNVDILSGQTKEILLSTAEKVLWPSKTKKQPWVTK